jgi:hypothetical protein
MRILATVCAHIHMTHICNTCIHTYNVYRVVECRLASALLAQAAGVPKWRDVRILLEVQRAGSQTLQEMVQFAKQHLPAEGTTKDALRNLLGCDPAELFGDMPKGVEVLGASDDFWLRVSFTS